MNILVVDDDPLAGELAAAALEDAGHRCWQVENALDALERLAGEPPIHLVVSDMHMPLVSGLGLLRELRERGYRDPFVLLTGDRPETVDAAEPGLTGTLPKDEQLDARLCALVAQLAQRAD